MENARTTQYWKNVLSPVMPLYCKHALSLSSSAWRSVCWNWVPSKQAVLCDEAQPNYFHLRISCSLADMTQLDNPWVKPEIKTWIACVRNSSPRKLSGSTYARRFKKFGAGLLAGWLAGCAGFLTCFLACWRGCWLAGLLAAGKMNIIHYTQTMLCECFFVCTLELRCLL